MQIYLNNINFVQHQKYKFKVLDYIFKEGAINIYQNITKNKIKVYCKSIIDKRQSQLNTGFMTKYLSSSNLFIYLFIYFKRKLKSSDGLIALNYNNYEP